MTTIDAQGRFEIKEFLGGRYMLSVSKAGYVTMSYGQRRPEQQGTLLESIRDQASRVSLGEGETKVQDLRVAKQ